jgi:hypothetical protein
VASALHKGIDMANMLVEVSDFEWSDTSKVVALPDCFSGEQLKSGGKLDNVVVSYDGGRLSVYINGSEVLYTSVSNSFSAKVEFTNAKVTDENVES